MTFKTQLTLIVTPALASMLMVNAWAHQSGGIIEEARVMEVTPVYRTVQVSEPVERCWEEQVKVTDNAPVSHTSTILGTIVGAAVGNRFGEGEGRDVATVAGAVLGGSVGRDIRLSKQANNNTGSYQYVRRCEMVDVLRNEERMDGYDVTFDYNGMIYNTRTKQRPGETLAVRVNVVPVE